MIVRYALNLSPKRVMNVTHTRSLFALRAKVRYGPVTDEVTTSTKQQPGSTRQQLADQLGPNPKGSRESPINLRGNRAVGASGHGPVHGR